MACIGVVLALIAGGCEPGAPPRPSIPSPPAGVAASTFRFGVLGEPTTLDPYSPAASDLTWHLIRPVYRSLYRFAPDGSATADLAREVDPVAGGVVISLRDAKWSDGERLSAMDVARSIARSIDADRLPGITGVRAAGPSSVWLDGRANDWAAALAAGSIVLPAGRVDPGLAAGPLRIASRRAGLRIVYARNPRWVGNPSRSRRVIVQFIQSLDVMSKLLSTNRLEAAAPPSAVNMGQRLHALGLEMRTGLGSERVYLDLAGSDLTARERRFVARTIDRPAIEEGFVRASGELDGSVPAGPQEKPVGGLELAAPGGDELLILIQRVIQDRLKTSGVSVDLVVTEPRTFYSEWAVTDPFDLAVRRTFDPRSLGPDALRLFRVETVIAFRDGVTGVATNPTIDGPLWNAERWFIDQ